MSKAIEVKWLGATNTKPARIVAFAEGGNRYMTNRNYDYGTLQQEASAAYCLADKLGWHGLWIAGYLPNRNCVFVNVGRKVGQLASLSAYLETLELGSYFEIMERAS